LGWIGFRGKGQLVDLSDALAARRSPRTQARLSAHIVEVLETIDRVALDGRPAELRSSFVVPPLLDEPAPDR
jgi:hypothetical protein